MTSQEEKELLLRIVMRLAQQHLGADGLSPFAAVLNRGRQLKLLLPESMKPNPAADELERYWLRELRKAITDEADARAACHCATVQAPTEQGGTVPGIWVFLEHIEDGAEDLVFPYWKNEKSEYVFGDATVVASERKIFVSP
jgi:hypothetical protein